MLILQQLPFESITGSWFFINTGSWFFINSRLLISNNNCWLMKSNNNCWLVKSNNNCLVSDKQRLICLWQAKVDRFVISNSNSLHLTSSRNSFLLITNGCSSLSSSSNISWSSSVVFFMIHKIKTGQERNNKMILF